MKFTKDHLLLIFAMLLNMTGCYQSQGINEMKPVSVIVAEAEKRDIDLYKEYTGKTDANESVEVVARVRGYLEEICFTPGDFVEKGDLLFKIEQSQYIAAVERAEAELEKAKADTAYAEADYKRTQKLQSSKASTEDELEMKYRNLQQAKASIKAAEANLIDARRDLSYTEIKAPLSGKINRDLYSVGNLVGDALGPMTSIKNMDPIYVYFQISDNDFAELLELYGTLGEEMRNGNARSIEWPFYMQLVRQNGIDSAPPSSIEDYPYEGRINYMDNAIDTNVGAITVRGTISNPTHEIVPGWVCRVRVPGKSIENAVIVHERAVCVDMHTYYMLVVDAENKVQRRTVKKGVRVGDNRCIIENGLKAGDRYILEGLQKVRVGQSVTIKENRSETQRDLPSMSASSETLEVEQNVILEQ